MDADRDNCNNDNTGTVPVVEPRLAAIVHRTVLTVVAKFGFGQGKKTDTGSNGSMWLEAIGGGRLVDSASGWRVRRGR